MIDRKELQASGYTVTAEKTGATYPNHAHEIGLGWAFVLRKQGEKINEWSRHDFAWAWAHRLSQMVAA